MVLTKGVILKSLNFYYTYIRRLDIYPDAIRYPNVLLGFEIGKPPSKVLTKNRAVGKKLLGFLLPVHSIV